MFDAGFDMGFRYSELRNMTTYEFSQLVRAYDRRQEMDWHRIRVLASIIIQPHMKKGRRIRPQDLIPLPSDVKEPKRQMSKDQVDADVDRKIKLFKKTRGIA